MLFKLNNKKIKLLTIKKKKFFKNHAYYFLLSVQKERVRPFFDPLPLNGHVRYLNL